MKPSRNTREIGKGQESLAAQFLKDQGYQILYKNYCSRMGEIDLIAQDGGCLCFVEVKYRSGMESGSPEEAVTVAKQRKLSAAARYFLMREAGTVDIECRFDVIAIEGNGAIRHIKNAFYAQ